jgi:hypothetical protein
MPSKQDAEREAAALIEKAIKDADKVRAAADADAKKLVTEAEKRADVIRLGGEDERIKKLMTSSPRRLELLEAIGVLEKQKGKLKGELEAHDKACLAERQAIEREREKVRRATAAEQERVLTEAGRLAGRMVADADAYIQRQTERKAAADEARMAAERAATSAQDALAALNRAIAEAEAHLAELRGRIAKTRNEGAEVIARFKRAISDIER